MACRHGGMAADLMDEAYRALKGSSAEAGDIQVLMRRCGVEMNEAIFLLEAAGGDVRAAAKLASSSTSWAAPAARAGFGSLTAATNLALANACKTSPPEDAPGSPMDADEQWPSIDQAMAAEADDWALVEDVADGENAQPDETWVELDLEGEEAEKPASFKDKILTPADPSVAPNRAPESNLTKPKKEADKPPATACDMFRFDEAELHDELIHGDKAWKKHDSKGKRDGHSKNSKKGSRQARRERKNKERSTM